MPFTTELTEQQREGVRNAERQRLERCVAVLTNCLSKDQYKTQKEKILKQISLLNHQLTNL